VKGFISKVKRLGAFILAPVLAIAGAGLFAYGVSLIYLPAAFIAGGLILGAAAWDASR
jgi:uncharacterized membrane-anchored protein YitT (DUF2179 family)